MEELEVNTKNQVGRLQGLNHPLLFGYHEHSIWKHSKA